MPWMYLANENDLPRIVTMSVQASKEIPSQTTLIFYVNGAFAGCFALNPYSFNLLFTILKEIAIFRTSRNRFFISFPAINRFRNAGWSIKRSSICVEDLGRSYTGLLSKTCFT